MQSMVFAGVFPLDAQDFQKLEEAIGRVSRGSVKLHLKITAKPSCDVAYIE